MNIFSRPGQQLLLPQKLNLCTRYFGNTPLKVFKKKKLLSFINQLHDTIKFPDSQISDTIDFLDFTISINNISRRLEFELFIKPSNVGIFLSFESAHPKSVLLSVAENELRRAVKRSNTDLG